MSQEMLISIMALLAVAAIVYFIFSLTSGSRDKAEERLERYRTMRGSDQATVSSSEKLQDLLEKAAPTLARPLTPQTAEEQSELKIRMANAGWRGENAATIYLGVKFAFLVVGLVIALTTVLPAYGFNSKNGWLWAVAIGGLFFYLPGIFVWWRVKTRQEQIFFGLPDALDLMVVCVEAGLGLDAAMRKVCEEMGQSYPIISEEFSICNFQLQMGRPRREVLHDLGVRTGVDDMKSLAAILIQADRFGSSIAQALRVQSDSMRVRRRQEAEERAAKTAVQLIFPLVLFIFPAVFVVLVGPAAIQIMENIMNR